MPRRVDRLFHRFQRTGDPRFLGRVFDRTAKQLLHVALYLTHDRHRAEDVVQTTFLTAIENAAAYDPERPVLPWLLTILANHARQLHRRERRRASPGDGVAGVAAAISTTAGDVADAAAAAEFVRECDRALDVLPEPYRPVLLLHLRHGLSGQEIAATLARPESTVRNQIARGLELLRHELPAGIVGAGLLASLSGRGLAAVRDAVLAQVPAPAGAAAAAAGGGVRLLGGWLVLKKLVVALVLVAAVGVGVWSVLPEAGSRVGSGSPLAPRPGNVPAAASSPTPTAASSAMREEVPVADPGDQPGTGDVVATVVFADEAAPVAEAMVTLWSIREGESNRFVGDGETDAAGMVGFASLVPGTYWLLVEHPRHQETFSIEAGSSHRVRCEVPRGFRVAGCVVDGKGRALAGAEVRCGFEWGEATLARSDFDGAFTCTDLRGRIALWATCSGRQPSKRLWLDVANTDDVRIVVAKPGMRMSGRAVDEQGVPVARAFVVVGFDLDTGATWPEFERHLVRADSAGAFAIDWARPGQVVVTAVPPDGDLERASCRTLALAEGTFAFLQLQLGDGAKVAGVAVDDAGRPVPGARIEAKAERSGLGAFDVRRARARPDGAFVLRGVGQGTTWLDARRSSLQGLGDTLRVELQTRQRLAWTPVLAEGSSLVVQVVDADDKPQVGCHLRLAAEGRDRASATTDAEGRCRFEHLPAFVHTVKVYDRSHAGVLAERSAQPGPDELVIRLDGAKVPSARVSGRVVDAQGQPVAEAGVAVSSRSGFQQTPRLDRDGRFTTDLLPPGCYYVHVGGAARGLGSVSVEATLVAGQRHDFGDLVLPATASLTVRVRGPGGESVRDAMVRLANPKERWSSSQTTPADEVDGFYHLTLIQPGVDFVLRFQAANLAPQCLPFSFAAGERRELDLVAVPATPVVFEVRCALVHPKGSGNLDAQLDVYDATGARVVAMRLSPYFDDLPQRLEWVRLGLAPGRYRVQAEEAGCKRTTMTIEVTAAAPAQPFVIDLR